MANRLHWLPVSVGKLCRTWVDSQAIKDQFSVLRRNPEQGPEAYVRDPYDNTLKRVDLGEALNFATPRLATNAGGYEIDVKGNYYAGEGYLLDGNGNPLVINIMDLTLDDINQPIPQERRLHGEEWLQ